MLLTRFSALVESFFLSQYEEIQTELSGLRERHENAEEEKRSISLELQQSQERLRLLQDKENHVSVTPT